MFEKLYFFGKIVFVAKIFEVKKFSDRIKNFRIQVLSNSDLSDPDRIRPTQWHPQINSKRIHPPSFFHLQFSTTALWMVKQFLPTHL